MPKSHLRACEMRSGGVPYSSEGVAVVSFYVHNISYPAKASVGFVVSQIVLCGPEPYSGGEGGQRVVPFTTAVHSLYSIIVDWQPVLKTVALIHSLPSTTLNTKFTMTAANKATASTVGPIRSSKPPCPRCLILFARQ